MFGAILKAKNSSFQNGMTFCRSIYVKKVIKLLAFILNSSRIFLVFFRSKKCVSVITCKVRRTFSLEGFFNKINKFIFNLIMKLSSVKSRKKHK